MYLSCIETYRTIKILLKVYVVFKQISLELIFISKSSADAARFRPFGLTSVATVACKFTLIELRWDSKLQPKINATTPSKADRL